MITLKRFVMSSAVPLLLVPLLASAIGLQVIVDGKAIVFKDVSQSAWFATYVSQSAELGIVSGYKDRFGNPLGEFRPDNNITVAEALKIMSEGAGYNEGDYGAKIASGTKHWSSAYVAVAIGEKFLVMNATNAVARLESRATRAEVAALVTSAFRVDTSKANVGGNYTDVSSSTKFAASIDALTRDKVVSGDTDANGELTGTFRPTASINRAEVAKMVIEARNKYGTPGKDRMPPEQSGEEMQENVVVYTNDGFTPSVLRIKKGEMVTFRNDSAAQLWVASDPHPVHTLLPGFDALKNMGQSQSYAYTFTQIGTFGFHNHNNASHRGTIIVEE